QIDAPLLEVWLFDFDESLYGQTIETELVAFLRGEMKFDGLDALKVQIEADAAAARALLAGSGGAPVCRHSGARSEPGTQTVETPTPAPIGLAPKPRIAPPVRPGR